MTKTFVVFSILLFCLTVYGSICLRHAFTVKHNQTITTNQIIDEASR